MTAKRHANCHGCGTALDATGFCWKCAGEGPPQAEAPAPAPREPEVLCTPEQNAAGLAALRAAVFGKPGPMAREIDRVVARLAGQLELEEERR